MCLLTNKKLDDKPNVPNLFSFVNKELSFYETEGNETELEPEIL